MPRPMGQLRVLFSSRVLLDLEEADTVFREKGVQAYTDYLRGEGDYKDQGDTALGGFRRLGKGPLFDLAQALHALNVLPQEAGAKPLVEIGLSCKDEVPSARVIYSNLAAAGLGPVLEWGTATSGHPVDGKIHKAFNTDLFLTRSAVDAQTAVNNGVAAAIINFPASGTYDYGDKGPVRIIVDGDAVAFGDSAEVGFRNDTATISDYGAALAQYKARESKDASNPVEPGPFTAVLAKISELNALFPKEKQPFEIGLLTARGGLSAERAMASLEAHGIRFNYPSGFMGGAEKGAWLEAHRPHLFLDDQSVHLERGRMFCPTGLVPYREGGAMDCYQKAQAQKVAASAPAPANDIAPVGTAFAGAAACEGKTCTKPDCAAVHREIKAARKRGLQSGPK